LKVPFAPKDVLEQGVLKKVFRAGDKSVARFFSKLNN